MKKISKILVILVIFYISIIIFTTIDFTIVASKYQAEYETELGLGSILMQVASTMKFTSFTVVLALIAKASEKVDSVIKTTIYFLPLLSFLSFPVIVWPVCKIVEMLSLVNIN